MTDELKKATWDLGKDIKVFFLPVGEKNYLAVDLQRFYIEKNRSRTKIYCDFYCEKTTLWQNNDLPDIFTNVVFFLLCEKEFMMDVNLGGFPVCGGKYAIESMTFGMDVSQEKMLVQAVFIKLDE